MASMFLGMTLSYNHNCGFAKWLELELCGWEMIGCPAVRVCNEYKHFKRALDAALVLRDFVHSLMGACTSCQPEPMGENHANDAKNARTLYRIKPLFPPRIE